MEKSLMDKWTESLDKAEKKRLDEQKKSSYPCLNLFPFKDADDWTIEMKCGSCKAYDVDISRWKTTDDIKAMLGKKCPKCGKILMDEATWQEIYDCACGLHRPVVKVVLKLWNKLCPKKYRNMSCRIKNGKMESLIINKQEIKL